MTYGKLKHYPIMLDITLPALILMVATSFMKEARG
jgi:hypothetical protein